MKKILLTLATVAMLAGLAGTSVVYFGLYDVSATDQHLWPTFKLMETTMRRAVKQRAEDIRPPPLEDSVIVQRGLTHYREHCVRCHGAPGVAPEPFALGMKPHPANLAHTAREWSAAELFWTVSNGIKMTGMPAWRFRLSEEDIWATVAFLRTLPRLSPEEYQAMAARPAGHEHPPEPASGPPDPERGKLLLQQYGCVTCHRIPGEVGPDAPVGPPLDGMGSRAFIAGILPNEPDQMERWLRSPQAAAPGSAMPDLGVSPRDARDMAAYLRRLK